MKRRRFWPGRQARTRLPPRYCTCFRENSFRRSFGRVASVEAMFLLGSISKPITVTPLMTLFEREFKMDDTLKKFLPQFVGDHRDEVTIRCLLTHVSWLPDQLQKDFLAPVVRSHRTETGS